jgi:hypothetical protein
MANTNMAKAAILTLLARVSPSIEPYFEKKKTLNTRHPNVSKQCMRFQNVLTSEKQNANLSYLK